MYIGNSINNNTNAYGGYTVNNKYNKNKAAANLAATGTTDMVSNNRKAGFASSFADPEEFYYKWMNSFLYRRDEAGTAFEPGKDSEAFGAAKKVAEPSKGAFLGLLGLAGEGQDTVYGLSASLTDTSQPGNPIVQILSNMGGNYEAYQVNVADVDIKNATGMEMYAILTYADRMDISGTDSSFEQFYAYALNAQEKGYLGGLNSEESFIRNRFDWTEIMGNVRGDYWEAGDTQNYKACGSILNTLSYFMHEAGTKAKVMDGMIIENRSYAMSLTYEEALAKKEFSSAGRDEFSGRVFRNFDNFARNAPDDVKRAWAEAADEIGVDGFGIGRNGMMWHISELLVLQVEMGYRGEGSPEDLLGNSVGSALSIARQALQRLDYPLEPHSNRPLEAQEGIKKEREFYLAFISKLEAMQERENIAGNTKKAISEYSADIFPVREKADRSKEDEETDLWLQISKHMEEMKEKLKNGEIEASIPIGGQSFTVKEWDELMEKFDKIEEQIRIAMEEEIEKRKQIQEAEKENIITVDDAVNIIVTDSLKCRYEQINPDKEEPLYITAFDSTGIRCVKEGSESFEWIIEFKNEEDYAKVAEFVNNLPEFSGYRFAPNRNFWEDFLSGKIDTGDFNKFINDTDDGKPDYLIQTEAGTYIDKEKAKYARYMNNPGFFTVLTLDEVKQRLRDGYYSGSDDDEAPVSAGSKSDSYAALHIADAVSRGVNLLDELRKPPKAPYEYLARDGVINYKGAAFILDTEKNSISLGDVSIEAKQAGKVISVPLEGGGTFNFNVDNMDQLGKAIGMFSPADINRIMRAIHQYNMAQSKKKELDDTKDGVMAL